MCSRDDYGHLGADEPVLTDREGRPFTVGRYVAPMPTPPQTIVTRALAIVRAESERRAVSHVASEGSVLTDPVEAMRAGISEPPYWAVIHPSGHVTLAHGRPSLRDLQRAVDGHLEAIPHRTGEDLTAYCNEDGRRQGLRPNVTAGRFLRWSDDILVGPVVLIGGPDIMRDDTALPAAVRMRLAREVIDG